MTEPGDTPALWDTPWQLPAADLAAAMDNYLHKVAEARLATDTGQRHTLQEVADHYGIELDPPEPP